METESLFAGGEIPEASPFIIGVASKEEALRGQNPDTERPNGPAAYWQQTRLYEYVLPAGSSEAHPYQAPGIRRAPKAALLERRDHGPLGELLATP